jgi:SAM-dependent methyltransferase
MMSRQEISSTYKDWVTSGSNASLRARDPQLKYVSKALPSDLEASILDAGCGSGKYAKHLATIGYKNVRAIDLFDELDTQNLFTYCRDSIDSISSSDESFDFSYCFSTIFYLDNPLEGFEEFHRVLKPGAKIIVSAHTKYSLWTLDRRIMRRLGRSNHLNGIKFYDVSEYVKMMQEAGFEVMDVDGYWLVYTPFNILNRLLRKFKFLQISAPAPKWLRHLRAHFGYHSLITAQKPL